MSGIRDPIHSTRSTSIGSTRAARHAGSVDATTVVSSSTATAPAIAAGSRAFTPKRHDRTARPATHAPASPGITAHAAIHPAFPTIRRVTPPRDDPSAMRMPISWRRSVTA